MEVGVIILFVAILRCIFAVASYASPDSIAEGQRRYEELVSQAPRYGPCWRQAIENLEVGCKHLTDEIQTRLALEFTNCLLEKTGGTKYYCPKSVRFADCDDMKELERKHFPTFTSFFTHTQVICLFLQEQIWQERTEMNLASLSETSKKTTEVMLKAERVQEDLLRLQQTTATTQRDLIHKLNSEFDRSRQEVASWARQQEQVWRQTIRQVTQLHDFFVNLFSTMYAYGYYVGMLAVSFVLTATKRSAKARYWLFLLFTVNFFVERYLGAVYAHLEMDMPIMLSRDGPVGSRVTLCRKVFCCIALAVLTWFAATYKDFMEENNRILLALQRDVKNLMSIKGIIPEVTQEQCDAESISVADSQYHSESDETFTCSTEESRSEISSDSSSVVPEDVDETSLIGVGNNPTESAVESLSLQAPEPFSPTKYNLRPRRSQGTPNAALRESVAEFVQNVTKGLRKGSRTQARHALGVLSSDED
ncbi:uncharacterized protein LOC135399598 [Ornithodoros turicata]|uniref:uncharacterized protein LOC135399598 n=1 Tax=Ornithodoros turicata TaxID=34597 RepID=UPI0031395BEC